MMVNVTLSLLKPFSTPFTSGCSFSVNFPQGPVNRPTHCSCPLLSAVTLYYIFVCQCLVSTLWRTCTLDGYWLITEEFLTTSLVRGGESHGEKINKSSLGFVLFVFQNKQSDGRKARRGSGSRSFRRSETGSRKRRALLPRQPETRHASETQQVIYRKRCSVSHPLFPLPFNWFSRQTQMRLRDHNYCPHLHRCGSQAVPGVF